MNPDWPAYRKRKCIEKVRYAHEGQAKRAGNKYGQRAYQCKMCDGWHLTSQLRLNDHSR